MKKTILVTIISICSIVSFSQNTETSAKSLYPWLKGMHVGVGVPMEYCDLNAAGVSLQLGYDFACPVSDKFAMGFYISAGGGFLGEFHPQYKDDMFFSMIKLSAGLMMEIGDLTKQPFLLGIGPGAGLGFLDMDLVLPVEIRFGRKFSNNWYIMGEISYGYSLAKETMGFTPTICVGYNFGRKAKTKKA